MSRPPRLERVLTSPRLPSLPAVAVRVIELSRDINTSLDEMAELIQNDQGLVTKILRTVNSSFYGLATPCPSIGRAIRLLGLETIRTLALTFTLTESLQADDDDEFGITFDFDQYWRRALFSALGARRIALKTGAVDPEEAFLAALVQDIGMVALWRTMDDKYLQIIDIAGDDHDELPKYERRSFQFDHCEVGAAICEQWRLPDHYTATIQYHHEPRNCPEEHRPIVNVVRTALHAANALRSPTAKASLQAYVKSAHDHFELDHTAAVALLKRCADDVAELGSLLTGTSIDQKQMDELLSQAEEQLIQQQAAHASQRRIDQVVERRRAG